MLCGNNTISTFQSLPVLIQFENVEENLTGQAALAAATVWGEKRQRGLQRRQAPARSPHRVQRCACIATAPRLAALWRHMAGTERKHTRVASSSCWHSPFACMGGLMLTWVFDAAGSRWCQGLSGSDSSGPPVVTLQKPEGSHARVSSRSIVQYWPINLNGFISRLTPHVAPYRKQSPVVLYEH